MNKLAIVLSAAICWSGFGETYYVATDGDDDTGDGSALTPWQTIGKAQLEVAAGDTVLVGAGYYDETVVTSVDGADGSRITVDGQGVASCKAFTFSNPYHTLQNMRVCGNTVEFTQLVWLRNGADYTIITNCFVDGLDQKDVRAIQWENPSSIPFDADSADNCVIINSDITGTFNDVALSIFGTNNLIQGNFVHDIRRSDFVRLWGRYNTIKGNTFTNNYGAGAGSHIDFIQTFGNNGFGSEEHIIEGNIIDTVNGQLTQLEGNLVPEIRNWTFRNNIFRNVELHASCNMPGVKYINNVFYRCKQNGSSALNFGGRVYTSATWPGQPVPGTNYGHNFMVVNNAFVDCGDAGLDSGWYGVTKPWPDYLTNCWADYNYVAKLNWQAPTIDTDTNNFILGTFGAEYDAQKWYEPHGIVGTGSSPFHNVYSQATFDSTWDKYPSAADFMLRIGATLVDAGTNATEVTDDYDGTARDSATDIGPLELVIDPAWYHVRTTGSDSAAGTNVATAWKTIAKAASSLVAGKTVLIGPGNYDENVEESTDGTDGSPITYKSEVPHAASLQALRLSGSYLTLDGLKFMGYAGASNAWEAYCRVEYDSHNCIITNCWFVDTPHYVGTGFSFLTNANTITNASADFVAAGFGVGDKIYLGSSGAEGYYYTNHDTMWIISSMTTTSMSLTNSDEDVFLADSGSGYWAAIYPGKMSQKGFSAVMMIPSGGSAATNLLVSSCLFSNLMGDVLDIRGDSCTVENCTFTELNSFRAIGLLGNNHVFRGNVVRNSPNIVHYSSDTELAHPSGTGWYDFQLAMFAADADDEYQENTNLLFYANWFEGLENEIGRLTDEYADTHHIDFVGNVFIGVSRSFNGGWSNMRWLSNTFYRCSFEERSASQTLTTGGRAPYQEGYQFLYNLFIDCGEYVNLATDGFYALGTNALNPDVDYNLVAGPELTGWTNKTEFDETNGLNGVNPVLISLYDADGPDDIPFTADDGIKMLPNSPALTVLGGAGGIYAPTMNRPVAHFCVSDPIGWWEATGTNYNTNWWLTPITSRTNLARPYDTPPSFDAAPQTITFDASYSMSGYHGSTTNTDLTYVWDFGDGVGTLSTNIPTASYTYTTNQTFVVSLLVSNTFGVYDVMEQSYAVGYTGGPGVLADEDEETTPTTTNSVISGGVTFGSGITIRGE